MITAEFVGGPQDGRIKELDELLPVVRFPVDPGQFPFVDASQPYPTETYPHEEYEPIIEPILHSPSINDRGHYRYGYNGRR